MSIANAREVEAKFQVPSELLSSLNLDTFFLDGYTLHPIGTLTHTDTYFDTAAYDLLRHGLALRLRAKGTSFEVGIKSIRAARTGVVQERLDIAFPLTANVDPLDFAAWPREIKAQLTTISVKSIKPHHLQPLVVVRQQRQKAHLQGALTMTTLAEWSLDEVWVSTKAEDIKTENEFPDLIHFHELEIELLSPEKREEFTELVANVQTRFNLMPVYTSKFVRGLESLLWQTHNNEGELTPDMSLEAAGRLLLHQQLFQILLNEEGVRTSKRAKYVHDTRVAIRRARAAIRLCADAYPRKPLFHFDKSLKHLARALGAVRDLDVALENLRSFAQSQPSDQHSGIKLLRAELKQRRNEAHAALLTLLDGKKHRKFIKNFSDFCATPMLFTSHEEEDPFEVLPSQVRHTLPNRIFTAFAAVRAYEVTIKEGHHTPLETFHALRIHTKYLRYLIEFTQQLLGEAGESLSDPLRDLQEHLGQLNDAYVEHERLQEWSAKTSNSSALHDAIETRLAQVRSRIDELATASPAHFYAFISLVNREKLAAALAQI